MHTTSVVIADPHPLIRTGIASMLATDRNFKVLGQACSASQVREMCEILQPHLIVLGIAALDAASIDVITQLRQLHPTARIAILSGHEAEQDLATTLRAGGDAFLPKTMPLHDVMNCLRSLVEGRRYLTAEQAFKLANRNQVNHLTPRELDILLFVATGMSNKDIANTAGIGVGTVKFHVKSIMSKLNACSRTEAAMVAARRGLVHLN